MNDAMEGCRAHLLLVAVAALSASPVGCTQSEKSRYDATLRTTILPGRDANNIAANAFGIDEYGRSLNDQIVRNSFTDLRQPGR
jgi:hypothetical protein